MSEENPALIEPVTQRAKPADDSAEAAAEVRQDERDASPPSRSFETSDAKSDNSSHEPAPAESSTSNKVASVDPSASPEEEKSSGDTNVGEDGTVRLNLAIIVDPHFETVSTG